MDVLSTCPLQVGALYWLPRADAHAMTVIVKGTFELRSGRAQLAQLQDFPNDEDNHWNDDPRCSVYSSNDMVPFKRRPDVMLVGEAFAPRGEPVRSLIARMIVGPVEKAVEVFCDRYFSQQDELVYGERFVKMQLRYERAGGGPMTMNPVGIDPEGERDRYGRLLVPNLQPVGKAIQSRADFIEPVGFGPIAAAWDARRKLLGRHSATWSTHGWYKSPLPHDIDGSYFNSAPLDQRVDELHEDERIVLENMHPREPTLVSHLPGIKPVAFVERAGAVRNLELRADTLWIDTTRSVATLTWRGRIDLDHPREAGRVLIGMQKRGEELTWGDIRAAASVGAPTAMPSIADEMTDDGASVSLDPELPFQKPMLDESTAVGIVPPQLQQGPAFMQGQEQPQPQRRRIGMAQVTGAIPVVPRPPSDPKDRSPSWLHKAPQSTTRSSAPPPPAAAPPAPPPPAPPPGPDPGADTYLPSSPWARSTSDAPPAMAPPMPAPPSLTPSAGVMVPAPVAAPPVASPLHAAPLAGAIGAVAPPVRAPNPVADQIREQSRADMPDAHPEVRRAPHDRAAARAAAAEIVELLWFDAEKMPRIRANAEWTELLDELRAKADAARDEPIDFDDEPPEEEPAEVRDRRDIVAIMTRGRITTAASLNQTMLDAVDHSGSFEPPVLMMSGRLHFPFDELETLKATLAAVTPLIAGNKDLKETVDTVEELMKTPWLQNGSGDVAEGLTEKVREAFKRGDRLIDPNYLDDHTERILLEQRRYQFRELLGDQYIRALLAPSASRSQIPCYVPKSLTKELPMFKSFPSRVIAEAHVQQDQFESSEQCLKVIALGRVVSFTKAAMIH